MSEVLHAPFPYFGGKRAIAPLVWERFGHVKNYVEPFFGSGAVLLGCPHPEHTETVNDADGVLCNFWRAVQADPEGVARHADYPVSELDLHARHRWLITQRPLIERLLDDPDWYDIQAAGWWVWGICQWIGSGWCHASPAIQLPYLNERNGGKSAASRLSDGHIRDYFGALAQRLRRVRITSGDFARVLTPTVTWRHGLTAVFLDPPYAKEHRATVYAVETDVSTRARQWCLEHGDNPVLRITLCGYADEHTELESHGWQAVPWKARGGYGSQGQGRGRENAARETIWFSPHCITPSAPSAPETLPLFGNDEAA